MKIFADLRWQRYSGIGLVKESLLQRLPDDFEVEDLCVRGRIGSPLSPWAISLALTRSSARTGVFWSPGYMPPATCGVPEVVTVHDLIHLQFHSKFHAAYYNYVLKPLYRRCAAIICVSEFTRNEFLNWSGVAPDKVFMIHNGVSEDFQHPAQVEANPVPYVFYPGNRRSHKNLNRLIQAYAASGLPARGIHLVLTGDPDPKLQSEAASHAVSHLIRFAGVVSKTELIALYRASRLVAYVSLYEGFGLPVIEGMAAGVPVLASNTSSIPEIAGAAALLVNPYSVEEIAAGLDRLAFDEHERSTRIHLGREQVTQFDWNTTASKLWSVLGSVATQ